MRERGGERERGKERESDAFSTVRFILMGGNLAFCRSHGSLLFRTTVSFPIEFFERGRSEVINQSRVQSWGVTGALPCVIGQCEVNTCSIHIYSHLFTSKKKKKFSDRRARFFGGEARDRIADSTVVNLGSEPS